MKPPARAVVGNLIWSADGGVWALWRVRPFPHAHTPPEERQQVHAQLRGLLRDLPPEAMLLSVCERMHPLETASAMAAEVDLDVWAAWAVVCESALDWLDEVALYRRSHYLAVALPSSGSTWREVLREAAADVTATFGIGASPVARVELERRRNQALVLEDRLSRHLPMRPVSSGEVCWLYTRALRREAGEPPFDHSWEPSAAMSARLSDVVVKEGGYEDDQVDGPDRLRPFVRVDGPGGVSYQTVLTLGDVPFTAEEGEELLYDADQVGFPVDWCVRLRWAGEGEASRQAAVEQAYNGNGIAAVTRGEEPETDTEPRLQATALLSVASPTLDELEEKAEALTETFGPYGNGLGRPSNGQLALLRTMLPGTAVPPVCRDSTQFVTATELAATAPFCGGDVGDTHGLLLGVSLDGGTGTPVLFDPAFNPDGSPSLAMVGDPGSGKTFLLKRLCWDTVARGGQVVVIDQSEEGDFERLTEMSAGGCQVVRFEGSVDVDPEALDADFVVLWAPAIVGSPEQLGALIELAGTVLARSQLRVTALAIDDADQLLATPDGQRLLAATLRETQQHNTAVWLSADDPTPLVTSGVHSLLGSRFVFYRDVEEIPAALQLLGATGSVEAAQTLADGLGVGQCLWRDRQGQLGYVQVLPPGLPELEGAFDLAQLELEEAVAE